MSNDNLHSAVKRTRERAIGYGSSAPLCTPTACKRTSTLGAAVWMLLISVGLFFLPIIGNVVGGFVGGCKVGVVRKALIAALLPSLVISAALWLLLTAFEFPFLGLLAGVGAGVVLAVSNMAVIIGAVLGALANPEPQLPRAQARGA